MSRRRRQKSRLHCEDPKYQSILVNMVVNRLIRSGKKSLSYRILYTVIEQIYERTKREPLAIFEYAIRIVTPAVHLKRRRIGGTTYQIPIEVSPKRGTAIAIKWILKASRTRPGRSIVRRIFAEIIDATSGSGGAVRRREEAHRIAEANKAFARYRFSFINVTLLPRFDYFFLKKKN